MKLRRQHLAGRPGESAIQVEKAGVWLDLSECGSQLGWLAALPPLGLKQPPAACTAVRKLEGVICYHA